MSDLAERFWVGAAESLQLGVCGGVCAGTGAHTIKMHKGQAGPTIRA